MISFRQCSSVTRSLPCQVSHSLLDPDNRHPEHAGNDIKPDGDNNPPTVKRPSDSQSQQRAGYGLQPVTGTLLALAIGWPLDSWWIVVSIGLYVITGMFWVPVVWIQQRMRDLAREAARDGTALPEAYHRLFRIWFAFGFPAFFAVMGIIWLMITRP